MPFGHKNAPEMFQRTMDVISSSIKWKPAPLYLDNIVVFPKTPLKHFEHVRSVLTVLEEAGVILKLKKCEFFINKINSSDA